MEETYGPKIMLIIIIDSILLQNLYKQDGIINNNEQFIS